MTHKVPPGYRQRLVILDAARMQRTLVRMAAEIAERLPDVGRAVLVGVRTRGVPLARRLATLLGQATGTTPPVGALDITLYRDDLTTLAAQPVLHGTDFPQPIDGRSVLLVDDVLFTGRTVRAALDELIDFGRPARIHLAVLIDRGHRELPIHADYVGRSVPTARDELVEVRLREEDEEDEVVLLGRERAAADASQARAKAGALRRQTARTAGEHAPKGGAAPKRKAGGERSGIHSRAASGGSGGGGVAPKRKAGGERSGIHSRAASGGSGGGGAAPTSSKR